MKKSILFVNGHLHIGGVEKALVDLLSWIDYERYDVDLLLLEGEGEYRDSVPDRVRVLHKDIREIEGPFWKNLRKNLKSGNIGNVFYRIINAAAKNNKKYLRYVRPLLPVKKHYDVAIAFRHGHSAEIVAYILNADMKVCWWHHGSLPDSERQRKELASLFSCLDKVVTVSEGCKTLLASSLHLNPKNIVVIPNIINAERINALAQGDDPFGDDNRFRIVSLSRFAPEKHLEEAVEAASMLVGKLDFVWYMIGDGITFDMVKERIEELSLGDRIILTGSLANPYPFLKHADLMVHPSHIESLCISVLEAMALGIPCVVVRSIGPKSFIRNGINGVLVDDGADALAEGIMKVQDFRPSDMDQMTSNGSKTVKYRFSPKVVISEFDELMDGKR